MKNVRSVKSRPPRDNLIFVGVVVLFIGILIYGIFLIITLNKHKSQVKTVSVSQNEQNSVLGKNTRNEAKIAINSHEYIDQSGNKYFRIRATITNNSSKTIQFSPLLQLLALDANNKNYAFTADLTSSPMGGPINAGDSVVGDLDFKISPNSEITSILFRQSPTSEYQTIKL